EIHAGGRAHEQPAHVWREDTAQHRSDRDGHKDEHDQRIRRKDGYPPVLVVTEAHLLIGEELMMVQRVALVDRAQPLDVDRTMHDEFVDRPFKDVREQECEGNSEPFPCGHAMDVLDIDVERRRTHRVDDHDVKIAIIPAQDAGPIFLPKCDLALRYHWRLQSGNCWGSGPPVSVQAPASRLIYHTCITAERSGRDE